jgi:hypothetical protein
MKQSHRRALISILAMIVLTMFLVDFFLWKVDPQGVVRYFQDYTALQLHALPAPDGLRYTPGTHRFTAHSVTIGLDGFRSVPTNRGGCCRITFIGDSVTFGMGANVSYVDLLAPDIEATVINTGIPGYNIENIALMPDIIEADGYIYLVVQNDADPPAVWRLPSGYVQPALSLYLAYLIPSGGSATMPDEAYFRQHAEPLLARDDVLTFAFEGAGLTDTARSLGVHVIPMYTSTASQFDAHPNPQGAAQIADAMRGAVVGFAARQCAGR